MHVYIHTYFYLHRSSYRCPDIRTSEMSQMSSSQSPECAAAWIALSGHARAAVAGARAGWLPAGSRAR